MGQITGQLVKMLFYCWLPLSWSFGYEDKKTKTKQNKTWKWAQKSTRCLPFPEYNEIQDGRHFDVILCKEDDHIYTPHKLWVMPNILTSLQFISIFNPFSKCWCENPAFVLNQALKGQKNIYWLDLSLEWLFRALLFNTLIIL